MSLLEIVDSHVHFLDPATFQYAWLGNLPSLKRSFLPADFVAQTETSPVRKIIFVESGCESAQSLAEMDWISGLAKVETRLKGIVAYASLESGKAAITEVEALSKRPLVKGVRRSLQDERASEFFTWPEFIAGIKSLAEYGFTFDLCVRHDQLRSAINLVERIPQVIFVLDHFGKPDVKGRNIEPWATDLKALAGLPNVVCKVSGLATEADWKNWKRNDLKFYFEWAVECFGFDRVLFGGDWPVATLATSYERWIETVRELFSFASSADLAKLFQTNAERIYRV